MIGCGDLSFADLGGIAAHLADDEAFLALPEEGWRRVMVGPPGSWRWKPRTLTCDAMSVGELADAAWYAIVDGTLFWVDHLGEADRWGLIWRRRGYRYTSTGRQVPTGHLQVKTISPERLADILEEVLAGVPAEAVELPARGTPPEPP